MSPAETAFLLVGLVCGAGAGAIVVGASRSRPGARRNVRVTIVPNAVPARRSATLGATPVGEPVAPVPGLPGQGALTDDETPGAVGPAAAPPVIRTGVPSGAEIPTIPALSGIRADAVAIPIVAGGGPGPSWTRPGDGAGPDRSGTDASALRRAVDERLVAAQAAQAAALSAVDELAGHRKAHGALQARVNHARAVADPRRIAEVRERLHAAFQARTAASAGAAEAEAEARQWLDEIGRLTAAVDETARRITVGEAELAAMTARTGQLTREAELARATADRARADYADALADLAYAEARRVVPVALPDRARGA